MSKKPNNKMIGLFIVIGLGLFIATMGLFISNKILKYKGEMAVMYFTESVKGLDVGSPVVFKGVEIGKVAKIDIIADLDDTEFSIPVYASFEKRNLNPMHDVEAREQVLNELINRGLRARLNTQNILTGQLMVELEMMPNDTALVYRHRGEDEVREIPTVLSPLAQLSRGLQDMPIKETLDGIRSFFDSMNNDVVPRFDAMMDEFSRIPKGMAGVPDTLQTFSGAMHDISAAAKSFRNLTDYIERHPESILRGKGRY